MDAPAKRHSPEQEDLQADRRPQASDKRGRVIMGGMIASFAW